MCQVKHPHVALSTEICDLPCLLIFDKGLVLAHVDLNSSLCDLDNAQERWCQRMDPHVECNVDSGSGLMPTLLDDVEQDLAVPSQDVTHALEHDLCGHHGGSRSLADPNPPARVMAVAEVDNLSDTVPIDFCSGNRCAAVADRDGEANIPGLHGQQDLMSERHRRVRRVVQRHTHG